MLMDAMDEVFTSSLKNSLTSNDLERNPSQEPLKNTSEEIAIISAQFDDQNEQSPSPISVVQEEEDITCIPSTDKVGIPLSFKTDVSTLTSMASKDPSPIIKTNFFKLPNSEIKSIRLKLSPQIREISPAVSEDKNTVGIFSASNDDASAAQDKDSSKNDVLAEVFEEQILQKETEQMKKNQKKYARKPSKSGKEKKTSQSIDNSCSSEHLEKLQESFNLINQSTVLEVAVAKGSDCKLMLVKEEPSRKKEDKVWLEGSESGSSYSAKEAGTDISFGNDKANISKQITTIAPIQVTNSEMSVQFHEVSNCMVTEADSSGLLMDIGEYNSPVPDTVREEETASMFSKILEESRLAGQMSKAPCSSTLVSTPTKFSHIREAEVANVSPFQQFLEKVGGMKSPIRGNEYFRDAKKDKTKSGAYDSGFDTLGQISSNLSLPILSPPDQKLSKRPRFKSPVQCFSQSYSGSPPQTKNKKTFSSQSPGKQELEEYYNMLCKTPRRESHQSPACSSQSLSDGIALKSQDYQIAEIKLSPFEKDKSLLEPHPSGLVTFPTSEFVSF